MNSEKNMKVLLVASEISPYAKTGGLADVTGSLPRALSKLGNVDIHTVMPKYKLIDDTGHGLKEIPQIVRFDMGGRAQEVKVKYAEPDAEWKAYFIDSKEYFDRDGLYGYNDDAQRFAFFARAVLETAKALNFRPDVIHCNDWHTGLVPTYLKTLYKFDPFFKDTATVFTIHNLNYRGDFPKDVLPMLDLGWEEFIPEKLEFWGEISFIKGGLAYSDVINTVSRTYSEEIQTPGYRYGEGLDGLLRHRRDALYGIVNGVDYDVWNPATDQTIARKYDASSIEGKVENKLALQRENDLLEDPQTAPMGIVSRLTYQKGLDIIANAIHDMIHLGVQFVLLGTGDEHYQQLFQKLAYDFPSSVSINLMHDESMARRIYAGSDMFLMPSRYEPCGLGQLISMRYGTIPIVRRTGGLADTVQEYDPNTGKGTGFCFEDEWHVALMSAVRRALKIYSDRDNWRRLILNTMNTDFSWKHSAREYINLYKKAMQNHGS